MKTRKSKLMVALLALVCSLTAAFGTLTLVSADEEVIPVVKQCKVGDLPYFTWNSNYAGQDLSRTKVKLMYTDSTARFFNKDVNGYNLKDFTAKINDNALSLEGFTVENWIYKFPEAGGSVVAVVESKIDGTIKWDYADKPISGWINWNSLYRVYKKEAATGTVEMLAQSYHNEGANENEQKAKFIAEVSKGISVNVKKGDVVYYELGVDAHQLGETTDRMNFQNIYDLSIYAQMEGLSDEITDEARASYITKLETKVGALEESRYTAENWAKIQEYLNGFRTAAPNYATLSELLVAYNAAVKNIDSIKENTVGNLKTEFKANVKSYYESLVEANYSEAGWTTITEAYTAFNDGIDALETEEAVRELYQTTMDAMKAVKAAKQNFKYLDFPKTLIDNNYGWIKGDVVDMKLMTGSVENELIDFDAHGDSCVYNSTVNPNGGESALARNWKWFVTSSNGVIVAYKANSDCAITVTDTRISGGSGTNAYTEDTTLTYYIVRGESVKKIKQVKAPKTDEDFGGTFYLQEGDMLYVEFIAVPTVLEGQSRNTESPYATSMTADSTAFDEEKYKEQNNDLPAEVTNLIAEKKAALDAWFASLNEADYSATNWAQIQDELAVFDEKCESEVKTTADVNSLYEEVLAAAKAVKTIAQTEQELKDTLNGYARELQAEYDKLVKDNKYTTENKAALDAALESGKTEILAAKSKSAGNTAKLKAIGALKAIEVSPADKGCSSSVSTLGVSGLALAIGAIVVALKKKEQ